MYTSYGDATSVESFPKLCHVLQLLLHLSDAHREAFDRQRFALRTPTSSTFDDPRVTFRDPLMGGTYRDVGGPLAARGDQPGDRGPRGPNVSFRDPNDVFREFFGGREPFIEAFSGSMGNNMRFFEAFLAWVCFSFKNSTPAWVCISLKLSTSAWVCLFFIILSLGNGYAFL